ncbi:uncharacterized protein RCC_03843 [Ramularia collo-cygni]|uniref:Uncharacterized protein n=1 Tax=Ramularia collo-cygni TaxID=112498 RepID=A0A2D3UV37_9PEZI|nr:uncharacterized protein RCC_03843 [Ramularia collo-cygni]CZT18005.1 uncharacterized protein RCC_03843 [Ramularia collo-cygni]
MPPNTTPVRPLQQLLTPSRPERVRPNREMRPQDIIARSDLARIIEEEVAFAQREIVARIDYILKELLTETDPTRRKEGLELLNRLQMDDLEDSNRKILAYRVELTQRNRALAQYEREYQQDCARG